MVLTKTRPPDKTEAPPPRRLEDVPVYQEAVEKLDRLGDQSAALRAELQEAEDQLERAEAQAEEERRRAAEREVDAGRKADADARRLLAGEALASLAKKPDQRPQLRQRIQRLQEDLVVVDKAWALQNSKVDRAALAASAVVGEALRPEYRRLVAEVARHLAPLARALESCAQFNGRLLVNGVDITAAGCRYFAPLGLEAHAHYLDHDCGIPQWIEWQVERGNLDASDPAVVEVRRAVAEFAKKAARLPGR